MNVANYAQQADNFLSAKNELYYHEYGVSLISPERMRAIAHRVGQWHEVFYQAHGWDNHQDVYGFAIPRD